MVHCVLNLFYLKKKSYSLFENCPNSFLPKNWFLFFKISKIYFFNKTKYLKNLKFMFKHCYSYSNCVFPFS